MARRRSLLLAESATLDLEAILDWHAEQAVPRVGQRLVGELLTRMEHLIDHPEMGRVVPEYRQASLRELIHPPYRIVYRLAPDVIHIVRVWRSERTLSLPGD